MSELRKLMTGYIEDQGAVTTRLASPDDFRSAMAALAHRNRRWSLVLLSVFSALTVITILGVIVAMRAGRDTTALAGVLGSNGLMAMLLFFMHGTWRDSNRAAMLEAASTVLEKHPDELLDLVRETYRNWFGRA